MRRGQEHNLRDAVQEATVFFVLVSSFVTPDFGQPLSFRKRGWFGPASGMVRPGDVALKHASRRCAVACGHA
jgi:hypothetical protein